MKHPPATVSNTGDATIVSCHLANGQPQRGLPVTSGTDRCSQAAGDQWGPIGFEHLSTRAPPTASLPAVVAVKEFVWL